MTLILAIPTREGITLASDSQITSGEVRSPGEKLFRLNDRCAWAGAGELALIQRVEESIGGLSADQPLHNLRDAVANTIKQCVGSLLQLDFRTQFFQTNPDALLSLHPGDFVFAECRSKPTLLHITSYGTPEWIDRPYAIGNGALFAYALLEKYQGIDLSIDQASLLALKVIEEAIEVGAYGLGPPMQIWHIASSGINKLDESRMAALADMARTLRESEIHLLVGDKDDSPATTQLSAMSS